MIIPVTRWSSERDFSKSTVMESKLKNTMTQKRLNK